MRLKETVWWNRLYENSDRVEQNAEPVEIFLEDLRLVCVVKQLTDLQSQYNLMKTVDWGMDCPFPYSIQRQIWFSKHSTAAVLGCGPLQ